MAASVKCGVKPPKDAEQLYEVEQQGSVVRGSRKMQHSNQLRCAAAPLPDQPCTVLPTTCPRLSSFPLAEACSPGTEASDFDLLSHFVDASVLQSAQEHVWAWH